MVNTTQFYKTKVALAVVLSLGLAACGDSEGDAGSTSNSTSTVDATQNETGNQAELTGTVQGVVVDTNGNPLADVMVYLGSQETTTNAGGQYVFTGVGVTNVNGVNNEGDESDNDVTQTLVVTIGGTADYLGALVTVTPQAQVNNTGGQGDNGGGNGSNSDTTVQTFVDGFTAEAGIAVLPMLNAGAYGYIRDCRTGAPLADTADILSLDFSAVSDDINDSVGGGFENGSLITTAEDTHTIGSDADGMFSLAALAANSGYTISAKQGWEITSGGAAFATASEGSSEFLGTIEVCPVGFTQTDITPGAPYISSVAGSIGETTGAGTTTYEYEVLGKGIDGTDGITLNFSEAISAADVDLTDVVVTLAANADDTVQVEAEVASVTLADDGMSMTVVLAEALDDETRFSIWFPQHQYVDNKSNVIVTGDDYSVGGALTAPDAVEDNLVIDTLAGDGAGSTEFGIASDVFSQETGKIGYIRARLCTYIAPPETPEGLEAEQLVKTLDSSLLAVSPSWDNEGSGSDVTNLNGQENAVAGLDTGERLAERFGDTFTNDTAVIVGSVDNATGVTATAGTVTFSATSGEFEVVVPTTSHGATVTLTPTGAFGVSGTPITVTLEDKVAPTTILQENYELWAIEADYSSTTASAGTGATGSGGEVAEGSVSGDEGDPIIYIQPRHLTPTASNNIAERYEEFDAFAFDTDLDNEGANDNPLYSGPGFAGWSDRGNSLGVAFSETIATGATSPLHSASVALALTGVLNGLTRDVDGNLIVGTVDTAGNNVIPKSGSDLARFTVADMIAFANNDHNEAVDFTNGSIVDARGNLANANSDARVVIRDAMPPFVTAGRWDGSNLIITFNETIVPENNDDLVLTDLATTTNDYTLTLSSTATFPTEGAYSLNVAGDELTVAINATNIAGLFQNGPNDEFEFDSDGDSIVENHLALNFDDIEDTRGNSWATFDRDESFTALGDTVDSDNDSTDDRQGRYLVDAPRFMVYNDVGIFTITKQTLGYSDTSAPLDGDDDGVVTLRFTFSHPIDLDGTAQGLALDAAAVGGTFSGPSLTLAEANALFQIDLDGPGVGAAGNMADANGDFSAYFSSDYTTITVVLDEGVNVIDALTTQLIFQDTVESAITDEALANETYTVVNSN
ncbi:carboxypeptidase-like regulatory domain-containing protein [Paraglaciecola arctica]|uniref:carboxypeptidase-like regulatory domain-containing protein n=1 Tax=Paraglaciecola arctica TaxID=1128911 RepID=UPI001C077B4A|nr:carboxypeptidase-like regulatory domain-containing protein [Paraglaciecola arctica]MBU3004179.1 carboxypeptidase-like regulatory domain-containing protein [Paraglaciecola arctica]